MLSSASIPGSVEVEAHLQYGVPGFAIVGLADRACQEAKERVRSGITSAELEWPVRRITVNLAPADLRKEGSGFDLPIALAVLAASHRSRRDRSPVMPRFGELALDGRLRPYRARSSRPRARRRNGSTVSSARPSPEPRWHSPESSRCRFMHLAEAVGVLPRSRRSAASGPELCR